VTESKPAERDDPTAKLPPALYLVATPIGNARDITLRALAVLAGVDVIACEDTRVTARLLAIHGIRRSLVRYDAHTQRSAGALLLARLAAGERVALVSDAGTPLVSDPGADLVARCIAAGIAVVPIPGPSAVLTALAVAGLPTERFLFAGFLPPRSAARRRAIAEIGTVAATLVLMEGPHRLAETLADLAAVLGDRPAAVARELTKRFEEVRRGGLEALARHYRDAGPPKGEVTLVIGPPPADAAIADDATVDDLLREALGHLAPAKAAAEVAAHTGRPRREVYARALRLQVKPQ
jgi:16S rRNA (cytidine1402-2'-O)-methyltransferase